MEFLNHLSILILLISGACKPPGNSYNKTNNPVAISSDYRQLAESRLGSKVQYLFNEAHTLVLCFSNEPGNAPALTNSLRFLIIKLSDNTILYQDQIANAQVGWYNNTQLQIKTFPGTIQNKPNQQNNYYIYDLETKQKLPSGANKL